MAAGWLSPPEVAAKHSVPLRTVQAACQHGALRCEKLGRFYLVAPEDAEVFAELWRGRRGRTKDG